MTETPLTMEEMQAAAHAQAEEAAAEEERQRILSERALDHLAEIWIEMSRTDAWREMMLKLEQAEVAAKKRRFDDMMLGKAVDQRDIDYARGYVDGLHYPLEILKTAQGRLNQRDQKVAEPVQPEEDHWA